MISFNSFLIFLSILQIGLPTFENIYKPVEKDYPTDLSLKLVALSHAVKLKLSALGVVKGLYSEKNQGTSKKMFL